MCTCEHLQLLRNKDSRHELMEASFTTDTCTSTKKNAWKKASQDTHAHTQGKAVKDKLEIFVTACNPTIEHNRRGLKK